MSLDDISFRNAVFHYHEELQAIEDGARISDVFSIDKRKTAREKGVFSREGKVNPNVWEVLKAVREYLAEAKEDWMIR